MDANDLRPARLKTYLLYLASDPFNVALKTDIVTLALDLHEWQIALQTDPQDTQGLLLATAESAFRAGHDETVCTILQPLMQTDGASRKALPLLLRSMHRQGHINAALALFESLVASMTAAKNADAIDDHAYGVASLLAVDANRMDLASLWSQQALSGLPEQREALVAGATAALAEQKLAQAKLLSEQAVQRYPQEGRAWSVAGVTSMMEHKFEEARNQLRKATELMPRHIGSWHALGWCELQNDLSAARIAFEKALALDHNFADSHGALAIVLLMQDHPTEAKAHITRALKLDPNSLTAKYAWGHTPGVRS